MGSSQSTFVFFSSFSVVLIAVDRLLFIVYPGSVQISTNMVSVITDKSNIDYVFSGCHSFHHSFSGLFSFCISTFLLHKIRSCVLRCCLLLWGVLVTERVLHYSHIIFQSWTPPHSRLAYVISGLVIQYLIPFIIVTMAYIMVGRAFHISSDKLMASRPSSSKMRKLRRRKRTDILLTFISLLFFLSWAPLNALNVFINVQNPFKVFYF